MRMRAMVLPQFGAPGLFELREIEIPEPEVGQVRVRVYASSVNPVDAKIRQSGYLADLKPPIVLGLDAAGVVEKCGPGVRDFKPGDEVYYTPEIFGNLQGSPLGTYADYNIVPAAIIAKKPSGLSFTEAAAIPLAGGTAWEAIVRRLQVRPGETVLIHAGAGGVGSFAIQFAKASGARVLATASDKNLEILSRLGADVAIDYQTQDVNEIALKETDGKGVDAAFDIEGTERVSRCLAAIRPFGRVASVLAPEGDLIQLYRKNITLYGIFLSRERKRLEDMRPLFERGQATALIDQILPLERVSAAHERIDSRHGRGKIVLSLTPK